MMTVAVRGKPIGSSENNLVVWAGSEHGLHHDSHWNTRQNCALFLSKGTPLYLVMLTYRLDFTIDISVTLESQYQKQTMQQWELIFWSSHQCLVVCYAVITGYMINLLFLKQSPVFGGVLCSHHRIHDISVVSEAVISVWWCVMQSSQDTWYICCFWIEAVISVWWRVMQSSQDTWYICCFWIEAVISVWWRVMQSSQDTWYICCFWIEAVISVWWCYAVITGYMIYLLFLKQSSVFGGVMQSSQDTWYICCFWIEAVISVWWCVKQSSQDTWYICCFWIEAVISVWWCYAVITGYMIYLLFLTQSSVFGGVLCSHHRIHDISVVSE